MLHSPAGASTSKDTGPRTRPYKPKVKTGCITCKNRRVKCDEAKPTCRRCFIAHVKCEGYKSEQLPQRRQRPLPPLLSRSTTTSSNALSSTADNISILPSSVCRAPPNPISMTALEWRYFQRFKDTLQSVGGAIGCGEVDKLILQSSQHDKFILQGVLAVGALLKAWESASQVPIGPGGLEIFLEDLSDREKRAHYQFSIQQYNLSLGYMLHQGASLDLRTILMSCWIIAAVESLHRRGKVARRQMMIGYRCLMDAKETRSFNYDTGRGLIRSSHVSVEDELVAEFENFHFFFDDKINGDWAAEEDHLPETFTSLADAKAMFNRLSEDTMKVRRSPCIEHYVSESSPKNPESLGFGEQGSRTHSLDSNIPCCAYAAHLQKLTQFDRALQPIIECSKTATGLRNYPIVNVLESQTIILQLAYQAQAFSSRAILDCVHEFMSILQLAKDFLQYHAAMNRRGLSRFAFEMAVISPLQFTLANCQDLHVREDALELLDRGVAGAEDPGDIAVGQKVKDSLDHTELTESVDGNSPDCSGNNSKLVGWEFGHYLVQFLES